MASQVLGRAVKNQIDPQFQGALIERRGKRVIKYCQYAVLVGEPRHGTKIGQRQDRIAWAFEQKKACIGPNGLCECLRVALIDLCHRDAKSWQYVAQKVENASIVVSLRGHMGALVGKG